MKDIAKKMLYLVLLGSSVYAAVAVYHWIKIDSCLDTGGRWDYLEKLCLRH